MAPVLAASLQKARSKLRVFWRLEIMTIIMTISISKA
jgi:hypothetical protein